MASLEAPPPPPGGSPPSPWRKSRAKQILHDDIRSGHTKLFQGPTAIYKSRTIFQKYKKENFVSNYYTLRKALQNRADAAEAAVAAYTKDKPLLVAARDKKGFYYPNSALQKQLRLDVKNGLTDGRTPSDVRSTRHIYRPKHIQLAQFSDFLSFERRRFKKMQQMEAFHDRMEFINTRIETEKDKATSSNDASN